MRAAKDQARNPTSSNLTVEPEGTFNQSVPSDVLHYCQMIFFIFPLDICKGFDLWSFNIIRQKFKIDTLLSQDLCTFYECINIFKGPISYTFSDLYFSLAVQPHMFNCHEKNTIDLQGKTNSLALCWPP